MAKNPVKNLRIAFFGTPDVAVHVLSSLKAAGIVPTLIVAAPDRPAGRGLRTTPPPASQWAHAEGVDVVQPEKISAEFIGELQNSEWDLFIVAAYGQILPKTLLAIPRKGTLNVHPSLLPKLRGASPIETAILTDAKDAVGVTIMLMDDKMDHGPIVSQARVELEEWPPSARVLRALLSSEGGNLLAETIPEWVAGSITPEEQDHANATFSKKFEKGDAEIDLPAEGHASREEGWKNFLKIRAFDTSPRAFFFKEQNGKKIRVIVTDAEFENGTLKITRVIPEGKKEMPYAAFLKSR